MENNYIWKVNGCEFELDMEDAETAEKYLSAMKILENAKDGNVSNIAERIRVYCKAFRDFYDELLGENASEKIFAGIKDNRRKYDEIYDSLLELIAEQCTVSANRMNEISRRYAPKRHLK
ncbi:MAG: hypothetical protein NC548_54980 [Lachnospiraceae bacterium]|nr:hypothetical protein [Lachnospiraceae bacterium]MCM1233593.1 hypothetical protein [Ruminococcus flavefaciens]